MLYTPPVTPWESVIPEVGSLTFKEGAGEGRTGDWGEVVTRYPYENVGMDHLLSKEKEHTRKKVVSGKSICLVLRDLERETSQKKVVL